MHNGCIKCRNLNSDKLQEVFKLTLVQGPGEPLYRDLWSPPANIGCPGQFCSLNLPLTYSTGQPLEMCAVLCQEGKR